jgi:hypothetical protein
VAEAVDSVLDGKLFNIEIRTRTPDGVFVRLGRA